MLCSRVRAVCCVRYLVQPNVRFRCVISANVDAKKEERSNDPIAHHLPSQEFIKMNIRRVQERDKLAQLVTELQLFFNFYSEEGFSSLTDEQWNTFFNLSTPEERSQFLMLLEKSHFTSIKTENTLKINNEMFVKISEQNKLRYDNGEMVYAPYFHNLITLEGKEFRDQIDNMYGSRLLANQRVEEARKLFVDCRFITSYSYLVQVRYMKQFQQLYENNWTSVAPVELSFVNLKPDEQLSEIMKNSLLFLYGPRRIQNSGETFIPHSFAPTLSTRGLQDIINQDGKDSVLYVSRKGNHFLPDQPPPNIKNVVLCASNDHHPSTSALSSAMNVGLHAYRIPFEKHIAVTNFIRFSSLSTMADIMFSWLDGNSWQNSISYNLRNFREKKEAKSEEDETKKAEKREKRQRYQLALQDLTLSFEKQKKIEWNPIIPGYKKKKVPRIYKHRYSREERNARRAAAAEAAISC